MTSRDRAQASIIDKITGAFTATKPPTPAELVPIQCAQEPAYDRVVKHFACRDWKTLTVEDLRLRSDDLYFMTPAAYAYFLPAFMIAALTQYADSNLIPHTIAFSLTRPVDKSLLPEYEARIMAFHPTQLSAIRSFLTFVDEYYSIDDPLGDVSKALASLSTFESVE